MDQAESSSFGKKIFLFSILFSSIGCAPAVPDLSKKDQTHHTLENGLIGCEDTLHFDSRTIHQEFKMRMRTTLQASLEEKRKRDRQVDFGKNQIFYKNPIPISKSKNYFLVWSEQSKTNKIVQAHFSYSVMTGDGYLFSQISSEPISYDSKNKRWYIPITEKIKNTSIYNKGSNKKSDRPYTEADLQIFTLYFLLNDQALAPLEVRLRVTSASEG